MDIDISDTILFEHWMALMLPEIKNKWLIDLLIPGSHDCNTNTLKSPKYFIPYSKCQEQSVFE